MIQPIHILFKKADERPSPPAPLTKARQVSSGKGPVVVNNDGSIMILISKVYPPAKGDIWDIVPNIYSRHLVVYTRNDGVNPVLNQLSLKKVGPGKGVQAHDMCKNKAARGWRQVKGHHNVV